MNTFDLMYLLQEHLEMHSIRMKHLVSKRATTKAMMDELFHIKSINQSLDMLYTHFIHYRSEELPGEVYEQIVKHVPIGS